MADVTVSQFADVLKVPVVALDPSPWPGGLMVGLSDWHSTIRSLRLVEMLSQRRS
jgi:hypothetical protein